MRRAALTQSQAELLIEKATLFGYRAGWNAQSIYFSFDYQPDIHFDVTCQATLESSLPVEQVAFDDACTALGLPVKHFGGGIDIAVRREAFSIWRASKTGVIVQELLDFLSSPQSKSPIYDTQDLVANTSFPNPHDAYEALLFLAGDGMSVKVLDYAFQFIDENDVKQIVSGEVIVKAIACNTVEGSVELNGTPVNAHYLMSRTYFLWIPINSIAAVNSGK